MTIPKKLHIIWIGDETKRPDDWIKTWCDLNPAWELKLWGNHEYDTCGWVCKPQMDILRAAGLWAGVADIMRYEILFEHGGFYVDADSVCIRPLDDWLLDNKMFAIYASEKYAPGLVANGFIGSLARHPVLQDMIAAISCIKESDTYRWKLYKWRLQKRYVQPWRLVGPVLFTETIQKYPNMVNILPSILFNPKHCNDKYERVSTDERYPIYARHFYGTTFKKY